MDTKEIQTNINEIKSQILYLQKNSNDVKYLDYLELIDILYKLVDKFEKSAPNYNIQFQPSDFGEQHNLYYKIKPILEELKLKNIINTLVFGMGPVIHFKVIERNNYLETINSKVNNIKQELMPQRSLSKKEMTINKMQIGNQMEARLSVQKMEMSKLHLEIRRSSEKLYFDGHYSSAIFEATKKLEIMVKEKSKIDKSGKDLMLQVFSKNNPILLINNQSNQSEKDEQEGFMHLFAGTIQGIKDPKSHSDVKQNDPQRCIEYLCLCSLLAKIIDESRLKE